MLMNVQSTHSSSYIKSSTYIKNYVLQSNSFYSLSDEDMGRKNIVIGLLNKNNTEIDGTKEFLIYTSRHGLANYIFDPINVFYLLEKMKDKNNRHLNQLKAKLKDSYSENWNDFKRDSPNEMFQDIINYFAN